VGTVAVQPHSFSTYEWSMSCSRRFMLGKNPKPIEQGARWAPVWTCWRREKLLAPPGMNPEPSILLLY